jgi:hypothetical protein
MAHESRNEIQDPVSRSSFIPFFPSSPDISLSYLAASRSSRLSGVCDRRVKTGIEISQRASMTNDKDEVK